MAVFGEFAEIGPMWVAVLPSRPKRNPPSFSATVEKSELRSIRLLIIVRRSPPKIFRSFSMISDGLNFSSKPDLLFL